jgi:hypothetical protein
LTTFITLWIWILVRMYLSERLPLHISHMKLMDSQSLRAPLSEHVFWGVWRLSDHNGGHTDLGPNSGIFFEKGQSPNLSLLQCVIWWHFSSQNVDRMPSYADVFLEKPGVSELDMFFSRSKTDVRSWLSSNPANRQFAWSCGGWETIFHHIHVPSNHSERMLVMDSIILLILHHT